MAPEVTSFEFTEANRAEADRIFARYPAAGRQSAILPLLHLAQAQHGSWLPQAALDYLAGLLGIPKIRVYEVATFYDMYNTVPVGRIQVRVCTTTPCWLCGSDDVVRACRDVLGIEVGESTEDMRFFLREFECLGACANAPMMWIDDDFFEDLTYDSTKAILEALMRGERPQPGSQTGRRASMPAGGKTTLLKDPHRGGKAAGKEGPGGRDEEPIEKAKPDAEVIEHAARVEKEGRPAHSVGDQASPEQPPEQKDPDAR
jgi:NADH-quinone oxidoreductase subunit E